MIVPAQEKVRIREGEMLEASRIDITILIAKARRNCNLGSEAGRQWRKQLEVLSDFVHRASADELEGQRQRLEEFVTFA